ncbi:MAG: hypothetical protein JXP39_03305 [Spirochaetales bacterium]|jgi:hypothetical protein|nr:hypothetical protein [Spirochaetales bacterium]
MKHLEELLVKEIQTITNLLACQKRMYASVRNRDWIAFQKELMLSSRIGDAFLDLEQMKSREMTGESADIDVNTEFYRLTSSLPPQKREKVNSLFRELRKLLLLSRAENEVLRVYVTNARAVVSGIVDTLVPVRNSKVYTKRGSIASPNLDSLVLNQSM